MYIQLVSQLFQTTEVRYLACRLNTLKVNAQRMAYYIVRGLSKRRSTVKIEVGNVRKDMVHMLLVRLIPLAGFHFR